MDGHHVVAKKCGPYLTIGHDPKGHTKWDGHGPSRCLGGTCKYPMTIQWVSHTLGTKVVRTQLVGHGYVMDIQCGSE